MTYLEIVSGGQTGVDRAALDWAISNGIDHGGWCPKGRRAEDGRVPGRYRLRETPSKNYLQRTEWNVRDSDGTVIFSLAERLSGGSLKTLGFAAKHNKPHLHISAAAQDSAHRLQHFIQVNNIQVLNVAGPRASKEPGVAEFVLKALATLLARTIP
jgi:hypothetical protein